MIASLFFHIHVCGNGCFWSWWLVCWQVVCQEGDSGAFETDIRSESWTQSARKRASFMWLCIPPRHRQAEAQDKTCVPPRHSLYPPPHPLSRPLLCTQPPPLLSASDLKIYQRSPMLEFLFTICVSFICHTFLYMSQRHTSHAHTHLNMRTVLFWILLRCGKTVCLFFPPEWWRFSSKHTHALTHTELPTALHTVLLSRNPNSNPKPNQFTRSVHSIDVYITR